jgi:signal transduction histidine kinase
VIRVRVRPPGLDQAIVRSWLALLGLGVVLLAGALVLADRLGRSFVLPIRRLAAYASALGSHPRPEPVPPSGPSEVQELTASMNGLVERIDALRERERAGVADLSHRLRTPITALRLRVDALADPADRDRLAVDLDELQTMVDHVVDQARRSEREGVVARAEAVAASEGRARFWQPLAEDLGRPFEVRVEVEGPVAVRSSVQDLQALVDVLLDNVFTHTPDDAPVLVTLGPRAAGGVTLVVEDGGSGFPAGVPVDGRGTAGAGSTGLGLAIAAGTATESGGRLAWGRSAYGGARVVVELGVAGP